MLLRGLVVGFCLTLCTGLSAGADEGLSEDFHRGVSHAHIHRRGHGYGSAASAAELRALKELGVNWIAITPFGYQHGATADRIVGFPGHDGASEFFPGLILR